MTAQTAPHPAVLFICQGGDIELQALLLAASLHRHLPSDAERVACVPDAGQGWSQPAPETLRILERLGCRIVSIRNPIDPTYGLANKISCMTVPVASPRRIFLDSDIVCLRAPRFERLPPDEFMAKPVDSFTYGRGDDAWSRAYAAVGIAPPARTFTATVTGETCPPYFNSGVIVTSRGPELAEIWIECVRSIQDISGRYFQEQAGLALAVLKSGMKFSLLDEELNYPASLKPVIPGREPAFGHYHHADIIRREPVLLRQVLHLLDEHPDIAARLATSRKWEAIQKPPRRRKGWRFILPPPRPFPREGNVMIPELVLTGIPRSGTSYLCKLLDHYRNCVVINEPPEAVLSLERFAIPWPLACYFRDRRLRILNAERISNKLDGDGMREDTAKEDVRVRYRPVIQSADFVLGVKNTQSFLCRLSGIREAMPHARIIAAVRDPYDTIASWKTTFAHLRDADVSTIPIGHLQDPFMSEADRVVLRAIAETSSAAERRARLWRFLAETILAHREQITVVHYKDLVMRPGETTRAMLAGWPAGTLSKPLAASQPRGKSDALNDEDRQAIGDLCLDASRGLGLI